MPCPFCITDKEKRGVLKNRIIKEGKTVVVFLSNPRLMEGHLLVIPKRHVEKLSQLTEKERKELFATVIDFQEKILAPLASGCDIQQHYRPFQKQGRLKVNHLHIHLQPRKLKDELYQRCQIFETDVFRQLSNAEVTKNRRLLMR